MTPEGEVKETIKLHLRGLGVPFFMPVQTGFGKRGVDFYCTLPPGGRALLIEVKRPVGGKLTAAQKNALADNERAGGVSVVARCWADVADAVEFSRT
jgi:hypothetical protein